MALSICRLAQPIYGGFHNRALEKSLVEMLRTYWGTTLVGTGGTTTPLPGILESLTYGETPAKVFILR